MALLSHYCANAALCKHSFKVSHRICRKIIMSSVSMSHVIYVKVSCIIYVKASHVIYVKVSHVIYVTVICVICVEVSHVIYVKVSCIIYVEVSHVICAKASEFSYPKPSIRDIPNIRLIFCICVNGVLFVSIQNQGIAKLNNQQIFGW